MHYIYYVFIAIWSPIYVQAFYFLDYYTQSIIKYNQYVANDS